jgi:meso-butanediol dehydrogenase/(S,S)-butanediol dehydrogenase/diacetyl reductase
MGKLENRVAIVTGGGSGIGKAIACLFAEEGAKVMVADRNSLGGEQVVSLIRNKGGDSTFHATDVSSEADVIALINASLEVYGNVYILVNNAAIQRFSQLTETNEQDWNAIHNVNLKGVFLCCKHAIPPMIRTGGGSIINVASVLGLVGDPDLPAYCAAKGGVIAMTRAAALAYGPKGVRINCICPGDVQTPLLEEYLKKASNPDQLRQEIASKYALRRVATPMDIARSALFLAGEDSTFITGATLVVDGGLTVKCY